jgi:signal transduction histidine kinase
LVYLVNKISYLDKIVKGTDEIASGNLNFAIVEKGKGNLSRLSHNINNLEIGIKKSMEEQMKSERLKSELITNVSHDLKTPLTSIINYVNLLKQENLSKEEVDGYVAVLDKKTQRLKLLIEDLFEASKMASGAVELNIEKIDAAQLLRQSLAELDEKIKNSSLTFRVNIPNIKVYANLDGKKTWRIFENLIGNILKYSQPNSRVYIDLTEDYNNIVITMKNISSYEMNFNVDEIFERFKRGDSSRNTEGSGLGLAIAKSIAELQGGSLNIEIDGDLFKATTKFIKII